MNIFDCMLFNDVEISYDKWKKFTNRFNEKFDIYYQYIQPKLSNFELFLFFQKDLLIHEIKISKKIKINIFNYIPDDLTNGFITIIDNVLIYVKTDEKLKPIQDQTDNINKCNSKLSNAKFLENAKLELVELEKIKLIDFTNLQQEQILNTLFKKYNSSLISLILKFYTIEKIYWHIEYYRENSFIGDKYTTEWFQYIYILDITQKEIDYLMTLNF